MAAPSGVPVEITSSSVSFTVACRVPGCDSRLVLKLELDETRTVMAMEFLESRADVHVKSMALEFGWSDDNVCPGCRRETEPRMVLAGVDGGAIP